MIIGDRMILRKPYALFIKYFKLMHIILSALIIYSMYKMGFLYRFFGERIITVKPSIGKDLTSSLFDLYMFVIPFLIIVISIIILSVLVVKKKPYKFYFALIGVFIVVFALNNYVFGVVTLLENKFVDVKTLRLARDLILFSLASQFLVVIKTIISGTGFDIKSFDFRKDLEELEIEDVDREEFEFEVNIDTDLAKRTIRGRLRHLKYFYFENSFFVNIGVLIIIAFTSFSVYFNLNIYNKVLYEGNAFFTKTSTLIINKSYITKTDYSGADLSEDTSLVIIDLSASSNLGLTLEIARAQLDISGRRFFHTNKYRDKLFDMGYSYDGSVLLPNFSKYIMVYEIPNSLIDSDMSFKYVDRVNYVKGELKPSVITVELKPLELDKNEAKHEFNFKEKANFEDILSGSFFKINEASFDRNFKVAYNFCPKKDECFKSFEYIVPSFNSSVKMGILKINSEFEISDDISHLKYNSLFDFLKDFGYVSYNSAGVTRTFKIKDQVIPKRVKSSSQYIEVPEDLIMAPSASLIINVRNNEYIYKLK